MTAMESPRFVGLLFLSILSVLVFSACAREREAAVFHPGDDTASAFRSTKCPEKMVYIDEARVCMDMFEYPNATGESPMSGVKWEEAAELCGKQGKRLPTLEEWEAACMGEKGRIYPYGEEYDKGKCRVDLLPGAGPAPSGSNKKCHTPEGVFDLCGNLWEWTSTEGFEKNTYYVKGGSWSSFPSVAACEFKAWEPPDGGGPDYGFRCVVKP